ncbi:hypothetical protein [Candidatus Enterococcus murrayae]|uniref:Uncharacterized protein n=1 Tax=Candidatus Enterococcus murrayae TaxID=2815321 RepID=A0ABS3HEJ8_9ENTE|nr:hypothetical protein [Enterococcus sp. MJM16]MBO0451335.1 hypothetical protein [Enterococcus sp. MJM16]
MDYNDFARVLDCEEIIFFEDDFSFDDKKTALMYGFLRMNQDLKESFLNDIKAMDIAKLTDFYQCFKDKYCDISWGDEVPEQDIKSFLDQELKNNDEPEIRKIVSLFEDIEIGKQYHKYFSYYGLGMTPSSVYEEIFKSFIYQESEWKKFKIYKNYNSETKERFKADLTRISNTSSRVICIIDNRLDNNYRANEIIEEISKTSEKMEIISTILTSNNKNLKNDKLTNVYIQVVDKDSKNIDQDLKGALAKSAYSCVLRNLQYLYKDSMEKSFEKIITNSGIASYLSEMATFEGVTNYKVISNWIQLLFNYNLSTNKQIKEMIKLAKVINFLDDDENYSEELAALNTYEAFDYDINNYHEPPAPGDVFIDGEGSYYVLIGQNCDLMMGKGRKEKNGVMEFLKAEIKPHTGIEKIITDQQEVRIDNFKKDFSDKETFTLKISCSDRRFIDNPIIKLVIFNEYGECKIDLKNELTSNISDLLEEHLIEEYKNMQKFFNAVHDMINVNESAFLTILDSKINPRQINLNQYDFSDPVLKYDLRRICRINKDYVLYLNKLYLDYRGRHPFNTINLTRQYSFTALVNQCREITLPFGTVLSSERKKNSKIGKREWLISIEDLQNTINNMKGRGLGVDDCVLTENNRIITLDDSPITISCLDGKEIELSRIIEKDKFLIDIKNIRKF